VELINAVIAALHAHELVAFDVQVFPPEIEDVTIEIEFRGDASEGAVSTIVEQYVYDLGIGGRFVVKDLYALFDPLKLKTIEIISPGRDVQPNERSVIVAAIHVTRVEE
jgi:hypothetical protein